MKDPVELRKFFELLRKSGIKSYKDSEIEIELDPSYQPPLSAYQKKKDVGNDSHPTPNYTGEQVLFWSSEGIGDQ